MSVHTAIDFEVIGALLLLLLLALPCRLLATPSKNNLVRLCPWTHRRRQRRLAQAVDRPPCRCESRRSQTLLRCARSINRAENDDIVGGYVAVQPSASGDNLHQRFAAAPREDPGVSNRAFHGDPLTVIFFDGDCDLGRFQKTSIEAPLDVALEL